MGTKKLSQPLARTTVLLPVALRRQAKLYAVRHNTSVSALIIEGLIARLKERPEEADSFNQTEGARR